MKKKALLKNMPAPLPSQYDVTADFLATAQLAQDNSILEIDLWYVPDVGEAAALFARVFLDKRMKTDCTRVFGKLSSMYGSNRRRFRFEPCDVRWSKAALTSLIHSEDPAKYIATVDKPSERLIRKYFSDKSVEPPIALIAGFQALHRENHAEKRRAVRRAEIARVMNKAKPLPADWDSFIEDKVLLSARYIVYTRKGRKITGRCTKCKEHVQLEKAKHDARSHCPACGSPVQLKSEGITSRLRNWERCDLVQFCRDGSTMIRSFGVYRQFDADFLNYDQRIWEDHRYHGSSKGWTWYTKSNWDGSNWCRRKVLSLREAVVYPNNLRRFLLREGIPYCAADLLAAQGAQFSIAGYSHLYHSFPYLEFVVKSKMTSLAAKIANLSINELAEDGIIRLDASSLTEAFPYSKNEIAVIREKNVSYIELKNLRFLMKDDTVINDDTISVLRTSPLCEYGLCELSRLSIREEISFLEAHAYVMKQNVGDRDAVRWCGIWDDYLQMARGLGYDLGDPYYLYPKRLLELHDEVSRQKELKRSEELCRAFVRLANGYAQLGYDDGSLRIFVPTSYDEFVSFCGTLKLCAANPGSGYMKAYMEGKKLLFFVARGDNPDAPYALFEMMSNGRIGQISREGNRPVAKDISAGISKWHKHVALPFLRENNTEQMIAA